ncbi:MAG TPA: UvrD-helicase domain-containing protein [Acidimicrobiales bacterium]|nr:UvrD-helicase domain-containing protein [Acidimicrobiales bacterium]
MTASDLAARRQHTAHRADEAILTQLVADLTEPQRQAVEHRGGPLLVIAGAGSGKTRVLTRRIAHLLATGDAMPFSILAITFTNKAADEMRSRVVELVGPGAERMWVLTFHSACLRMLRANAVRIGFQPGFTVYDDTDSRRVLELIMQEMGLDLRRLPPRSVAAQISTAKSQLQGPAAYASDGFGQGDPYRRRIAELYERYERRLIAANAMDFDDLLANTVRLFRTCPDVLAHYRQRFSHILVDEYQDTNLAQDEIVRLLAMEHRNVAVVGDADQSIYRFRAADVRNILEFEQHFPDATVVLLEQNFRSTQTILDAANAIIANNPATHRKHLFTVGDQGAQITRYRATDEHDEAAWVASSVLRLRTAPDMRWGDVAIFYRTNAQSRVLEDELVRAEIPYKVVGGTRFYDRREIKDVLAYLRLCANPYDEVAARRIVNVPKRGIGATSVTRLGAYAAQAGVSFAEAIRRAEDAGLTGKALRGAIELSGVLEALLAMRDDVDPGVLVEEVVDRSGYGAILDAEGTDEAWSRRENLAELVGAAAEYETLEGFLERMALVADSDELDLSGGRVSLMTLHIAKGLEFDAVFLTGMEEGVFPHMRSLGDPFALEEERRLCYVGVTRARRHLAVSHAWTRSLFGSTTHGIPSRFLAELPEGLLADVSPPLWRSSRGEPASRDRDDEEGGTTFGRGAAPLRRPTTTGAELLGLAPGDRVVHERWGSGVVVSVEGTGEQARGRVRFGDAGEKQLLFAMAPLQRDDT